MPRTEVPDYVNEQQKDGLKHHSDTNAKERRTVQLLVYSFALLCVIQATLNVSLRLALHYTQASACSNCNATYYDDKNQVEMPERWKEFVQKNFFLKEEKKSLENRNAELEEESRRLNTLLRELTSPESCQQCPPQWYKMNYRCYYLSDQSKTWEESRQYCQSRGGDLVVINSEQEARLLYRHNGEDVLLYWIGLRSIGGTFQWVDGSTPTRMFWQAGEPNPNDNEDCVESYHFRPVLATWNDIPCEKIQRWMCEKDPQISP